MFKMDEFTTIKYPLATEKVIRLMDSDNVLCFVVDKKANKTEIKNAVEKMFKVKVVDVNTHNMKGLKRAYVKFSQETPAIDVATNLGLI